MELLKDCACEECSNIHTRKSKYCSQRCYNRQKRIWANARWRARFATDEEFAEKHRLTNRIRSKARSKRLYAERKRRMDVDPLYAEEVRSLDRERRKKRREDPAVREENKRRLKHRYENDEAFRQACLERSRRNREKKKIAKKILSISEVINNIGDSND